MPRRKRANSAPDGAGTEMKTEEVSRSSFGDFTPPDRFLEEQFAGVRSKAQGYVDDMAEHARKSPEQALLSAVVVGYLLRLLPTARLLRLLLRLVFTLLKPALLIYGISKLYHAAQQDRSPSGGGDEA